ncbi:putative urea transporter permease protein UrtB [Phaeobacter piscinae]|uniref:Urea transporter permease protein UrtB n=2 Tax=Phaeobacter piscinae TaxID=1580596 RepID=A0ABM6PI21_9RHOB|nr:putative urea transporter permease protein UrtB [Phaeobacter piscinae]AUQ87793.1 putative urea transporter permease protein UrtB [Phaeobacter piscinae]AUR25676.1 putative urea transporter permease protein UrtB [Phaeobacter piscinae]
MEMTPIMTRLFAAGLLVLWGCLTAMAQTLPPSDPPQAGISTTSRAPLQQLLQSQSDLIAASSRRTIQPAIDAVAQSGLDEVQTLLQLWQGKKLVMRKSDGLFFRGDMIGDGRYELTDLDSGVVNGVVDKADLKLIKPNSGVRALIGTALVRFQLNDPVAATRRAAVTSIGRDPSAKALEPLRASILSEADDGLRVSKQRQERLLTMRFDIDPQARVAAIEDMSGDLGVDVRAALNPLLATTLQIYPVGAPATGNIAAERRIGQDFTEADAYAVLVAAGFAEAPLQTDDIKSALAAHIVDGRVAGIPLAQLSDMSTRRRAYGELAAAGLVRPGPTEQEMADTVARYRFADTYNEASSAVTDAAESALARSNRKVAFHKAADLALDAISLASIYFLAAIGLAITFGVMGVINMAHGEFIMMGAYTGYVIQLVIPDHTLSILVAIPAAFAVTFGAGIAMERLVIRWLYNRPLETLLATFGISIALQQLAKNIFGTQARPLTAPGWLDGAWALNDVVSISYIRIAIFVLALGFLALLLFIIRRTRLGLETRAVTQNRSMAASMGINPDRVNMLTFGLGSGIAGIAGVAIGLFAKVTSELGNDYIVQSFMTVVVGGVGSIWGTLAGAVMIGFSQKGIEWLNPSNTLAAQTYMIVLIIIFIQFRPRGIVALRGRAAGD